MQQVHSAQILRVTLKDIGKETLGAGCDGVIIPPGLKIAAGVRTADCLSIFVYTEHGLTGALHAGWRSIAEGIGTRFLKIAESEGFEGRDMIFQAGPAICPSCYEVGPDVLKKFPGQAAEGNKLNLLKALSIQLQESGAKAENIKFSRKKWECTAENDCFFSHRRGDSSRMLAFAIQY